MVVLTDALVVAKTKVDSLVDVKNLNVCGQGIEDVSILQHAPNIEVLSLSVNKISTLRHFVFCSQLKQLYLRANAVTDLAEIRYLMSLPQLQVLWLADNPCAKLPHYRAFVVANLPHLENLDNVAVNDADRHAAKNVCTMLPATIADVLTLELQAAKQQLQKQAEELQQDNNNSSSNTPHASPRQQRASVRSPRPPRSASPETSSQLQQQQQVAADGGPGAPTGLSRAGSARRTSLLTPSHGIPPLPVAAAAAAQQQAAATSAHSSYRSSPEPAGAADLAQGCVQQQRGQSVTPRELGSRASGTGVSTVAAAGAGAAAVEAGDLFLTQQQHLPEHSCCGHVAGGARQHQHEQAACMHTACCHCHTTPNRQQQPAGPYPHQWRGATTPPEHSNTLQAASPAGRTSVLYAVMALLGELDVSGLTIVQREVQLRLTEHHHHHPQQQ